MPNRLTHRNAGLTFGAFTATACSHSQPLQLKVVEIVGGTLGGYIGGILPDILEPATSPNHRAFAHSWATGAGGAVLLLKHLASLQDSIRSKPLIAFNNAILVIAEELLRHLLVGAIAGITAGYLSHLALDSLTPRGLPLVG